MQRQVSALERNRLAPQPCSFPFTPRCSLMSASPSKGKTSHAHSQCSPKPRATESSNGREATILTLPGGLGATRPPHDLTLPGALPGAAPTALSDLGTTYTAFRTAGNRACRTMSLQGKTTRTLSRGATPAASQSGQWTLQSRDEAEEDARRKGAGKGRLFTRPVFCRGRCGDTPRAAGARGQPGGKAAAAAPWPSASPTVLGAGAGVPRSSGLLRPQDPPLAGPRRAPRAGRCPWGSVSEALAGRLGHLSRVGNLRVHACPIARGGQGRQREDRGGCRSPHLRRGARW